MLAKFLSNFIDRYLHERQPQTHQPWQKLFECDLDVVLSICAHDLEHPNKRCQVLYISVMLNSRNGEEISILKQQNYYNFPGSINEINEVCALGF